MFCFFAKTEKYLYYPNQRNRCMANFERDKSEFNSSFSYLNRINVLFLTADENAMQLNMYNWYHALLALFRELSTEMNEEELNSFTKESDKINQLLMEHMSKLSATGYADVNPQLYNSLHVYELKLRMIMKEAGLQQKVMEDGTVL
jgi:hypothetical protein